MNRKILSYDDVKDIGFGESQEPMVGANKYDVDIVCEYKKYDMFAWTGFDILVRESVAKRLSVANSLLRKESGLRLKVVYGYRSATVQKRYFDRRFEILKSENPGMNKDALVRLTNSFVAAPDVAGHTLGAAVDLTLIDGNGVECDMGTDIADYSNPRAIKTHSEVGYRQSSKRMLLLNVMMRAGFAPFLGEWWHFSYGDKEWAAYYKMPRALYSPHRQT